MRPALVMGLVLGCAASAGLGALMALQFAAEVEAPGVTQTLPKSDGELARLRSELLAVLEILEEEIQARVELADEVDSLRANLRASGEGERALPEATPGTEVAPGVQEVAQSEAQDSATSPVFDEQALLSSGLTPNDAARLRESWEEHEMEKLYLTDRATREGYLMSPRHRKELRALDLALRVKVGEESYDQILYATGRPNRVVVRDVFERSPADVAGLRSGDTVLSYAGRRVFRRGELRFMTATGEEGESVSVTVLRDGRPLTLSVPRGPLGVYLKAETQVPRD